jgi:hypothetical protein
VRWQRDYASIAAATVKVFIAPKIFSYPQAGSADYPILSGRPEVIGTHSE